VLAQRYLKIEVHAPPYAERGIKDYALNSLIVKGRMVQLSAASPGCQPGVAIWYLDECR
jgi:hypothetical protein